MLKNTCKTEKEFDFKVFFLLFKRLLRMFFSILSTRVYSLRFQKIIYPKMNMSALLNAAKHPGHFTKYDHINAGIISAIPVGVGLTELMSSKEGGYLRTFFNVNFFKVFFSFILNKFYFSVLINQDGHQKIHLFMLD